MDIDIRELTTNSELQAMQGLDEIVWNEQPIPLHQIITSIQNGGLVLGAYNGEQLVGFSYSFAGFKNGRSYLCSHMLGIHPDFQEKGIGAQLKKSQRQKAAELGYSMLTWTYDPLESRNAYLNLSKLRAICSTYVENCYGDMDDGLNNGIPSDRFKVEWWINSPHVKEQRTIVTREQKSYFDIKLTENGHPKLINVEATLETILTKEQILVPVPAHFQQIKKDDFDLAVDWRLKIRKIFQTLFSSGFAAVALEKGDTGINFYVLVKKDRLQLI